MCIKQQGASDGLEMGSFVLGELRWGMAGRYLLHRGVNDYGYLANVGNETSRQRVYYAQVATKTCKLKGDDVKRRFRILPRVSYTNFRKEGCSPSKTAFNSWFSFDRYWGGAIWNFTVKHHQISFDFRRNWVADMIHGSTNHIRE